MLSIFGLFIVVLGTTAQSPPMGDLKSSNLIREFCSDSTACPEKPLTIGGWNMQRLGASKTKKEDVVSVIVKTIKKYDLIVLQEVTDTSLKATKLVLDELNAGSNEKDIYDLVISPKIGPARYKEQYAYYFKNSTFKFEKGEKYADNNDTFQIEPFVAKFKVLNGGQLRRFFVIPLHSKPDDAVNEINALVDVYDEMTKIMKTREAIMIGDFNAGCSYVTGDQSEKLFSDKRFTWLISDHADTTTKSTTCPYDRIVIAGNHLTKSVYAQSAGPYYFDEELGFEENKKLTAQVSDHYPVGVLVRNIPKSKETKQIYLGLTSTFSTKLSQEQIVTEVNSLPSASGSCTISNKMSDNFMWIQWNCDSAEEALRTLIDAARAIPKLLEEEAVGSLIYKVSVGALADSTLYERAPGVHELQVSFYCVDGECGITTSAPTNVI